MSGITRIAPILFFSLLGMIDRMIVDVRYWPLVDIGARTAHVCFDPKLKSGGRSRPLPERQFRLLRSPVSDPWSGNEATRPR